MTNSAQNQFPNLYAVNSALAENENLSKHNKEVLEEFFDEWRDRIDYPEGIASRFNSVAGEVDFKLDEATRDNLERIYKKLSRGEITKQNGEEFSPSTLEKFHKAMSTFYRNFIDRPDRGYENKAINGYAVVEGQQELLPDKKSSKVKKETKPSASQIKQIANQLDSIRNRAIVIFGWSVGARSGEVFKTDKKPQPLLWEDIKFGDDDTMSVHLRVNNKKEEPTRRRVTVSVGKPVMERLYEKKNPDRSDPVFTKKNPNLTCPKCSNDVECLDKDKRSSHERTYLCNRCEETFPRSRVISEYKALKRCTVNSILKDAVSNTDIRNLDNTTHPVFRASRALQKVAMNWRDNSINSFFGWEIGSSAKKRYVEALQVAQKQDLNEEHPELDVNVEGRFHDSSLKPKKCSNCNTLASRLWDFCRSCDEECTFTGMLMKSSEDGSTKNQIKHEVKDWGLEYLMDNPDADEEAFKQKMTDILDKKIDEEMEV